MPQLPQTDHHAWANDRNFGVQPGSARFNLRIARLLVNAPFPTIVPSPAEMFDHVGDIHFRSGDPCGFESLIENPACGANKGVACQIFFVAGLFADEHYRSAFRSLSEHGLRGLLPEITTFATFGRLLQVFQRHPFRKKRNCSDKFFFNSNGFRVGGGFWHY